MERFVGMITALLGFGAAYLLAGAVMPLLRRLRFADTSGTADANGRNIPTGGGIAVAAAALLSAAAGIALLRLFSSELEFDTSGFAVYTAGAVISQAAGAAGFYSDRLKVSGKPGGIDSVSRAAVHIMTSAAFLIILYSAGGSRVINIPFYGGYDLDIFYYPIMALYMTAVMICTGSTDSAEGVMPAVCTACFLAAGGLLWDMEMNIYSIFIFASAGSAGGFLGYGFPPAKLFCGDCGRFFLGTAAAITACASGELAVMLIMLLPCGIDMIISLILKAKHMKFSAGRYFAEEKGVKKGAVVIIYFSAAVVISAAVSAAYYLSENLDR